MKQKIENNDSFLIEIFEKTNKEFPKIQMESDVFYKKINLCIIIRKTL